MAAFNSMFAVWGSCAVEWQVALAGLVGGVGLLPSWPRGPGRCAVVTCVEPT